MGIKLSHSALSKYQACAKSYQFRYVDRIVSINKSSSLFFGVAIDNALNHLLLNKDKPEALEEAKHVFSTNWEQQKDNEGNAVDLPMNPNIQYSKYDYDGDLLEKRDWAELFKLDKKIFETRTEVAEALAAKKNWGDIPEQKRIAYNFSSWLSLKRKSSLLIDAYYHQILPEIAEVVAVQTEVELLDGEGNKITGYVDLVAKLKSGQVAILDNKTSSMEYDANSVETSAQLALYQNILNSYVDNPDHSWKTLITHCGYLVMSKKLNKEKTKTCKSCGKINISSHKTCAEETDNGKRCGGDFDVVKKFSVDTQVIVDEVPDYMLSLVMENADNIRQAIETKNFPRNLNSCHNIYGKPCEYISWCHKGDNRDLIKLPEKK